MIEQGFSEETIESVSKAVNEQLSKNANDDAKQDDNTDDNLPKGDDANQTHSKINPITKRLALMILPIPHAQIKAKFTSWLKTRRILPKPMIRNLMLLKL